MICDPMASTRMGCLARSATVSAAGGGYSVTVSGAATLANGVLPGRELFQAAEGGPSWPDRVLPVSGPDPVATRP